MKIKFFITILFSIMSIVYGINSYAITNQIENPKFNVEKANERFDKINIKLSTQNLVLSNLEAAVRELQALQDKAKQCVEVSQEQLSSINQILKSQSISLEKQDRTKSYKYLQEKKSIYVKQLSECRLFIYRSEETIVALKDTIQKLSTHEVFYHESPLWMMFQASTFNKIKNIDVIKIYEKMNVGRLSEGKIIIGSVFLVLSVIFGVFANIVIARWLRKVENKESLSFKIVKGLQWLLLPILFFSTSSLFLLVIYWNVEVGSTVESICYVLFWYFILVAFLRILCCPGAKVGGIIPVDKKLSKKIFLRTLCIVSWISFGYIVEFIFVEGAVDLELIHFASAIFVSILSILIVWWCWLIFKTAFFIQKHRFLKGLFQSFLIVFILVMLVTEWLGYHRLAVYLESGILFTILLIIGSITAFYLIDIGINFLGNNKNYISQRLRYYLGIKPHKNLSELVLFQIAFYIVVIFAFIIALLKIWAVSENTIDQLVDGLLNGFNIANLKIFPLRIILAFVLFGIVNMLGRLIATFVARHRQFKGETDTQVAVASIIHYASFGIALLVALLIAGVNFTGLAIIAGALSVGIGLGLQTIVNNFVSGVILLLEKPIKPGDRVIVGDTEGFVRKIRMRSTQIKTLLREDVIVPNAELVTTKVTNYMFRDKNWRVSCQVGVRYGSDVDLVKKVLLEVAAKHPDVIKEEPNQPIVLFRNFGDSSLVFNLWCIIHDVNKKFIIESDLNFEIDKAFKKHGIVIAFPQRDVHIRDYLSISKPPKNE